MTPDELIARLAVWQEQIDPCERGHVEHGPEVHLGRRLVHTMAGSFGADWDYDDAVEFIRSADAIGLREFAGHAGAHKDGKWIGFAVIET